MRASWGALRERLVQSMVACSISQFAQLKRADTALARFTEPLALVAFLIYWNIGLIAQWTFVRPELRNGLIWDGMLRAQFIEVPGRVAGKLDDVLFHRCKLASNKTC